MPTSPPPPDPARTAAGAPHAPAAAGDVPATDGRLEAAALARLHELDPDGRLGVVGRVLGAFEASLQRAQQQLAEPAMAADAPRLGALAHTLKSAAASCGAADLSALCAGIEARVRADPALPPAPEIGRLQAAVQAAQAAVRAALRS